jgi:hypothetical protein
MTTYIHTLDKLSKPTVTLEKLIGVNQFCLIKTM